MIKKDIQVNGSEVTVLGITFKENCPDVRNTKVLDLVACLKDYGTNITILILGLMKKTFLKNMV